jgi:solute:Na+ symporter, SSS family
LFLFGTFWRRANATGAFWTLIIGLIAGAIFFVMNVVAGVVDIHFLYVGPILFVFSSVVLVIASLTAPAPAEEDVASFIWTPALYRQDTAAMAGQAWYLNYRIQAIGLIALTAAILFAFW